MIGARNAGSNHDQCLTCNVSMYNEHEYFDNTSKPQQQHKPYRQEGELAFFAHCWQGQRDTNAGMDLNPNKISTRLRK